MQTYIERTQTALIHARLKAFPAVALLGPRQTGKSTLAKRIIATIGESVYLDLADPRDSAKLGGAITLPGGKSRCIDLYRRGAAAS